MRPGVGAQPSVVSFPVPGSCFSSRLPVKVCVEEEGGVLGSAAPHTFFCFVYGVCVYVCLDAVLHPGLRRAVHVLTLQHRQKRLTRETP